MKSDADSEDGGNRAATPLELFHGLHIDVTLLFFCTAMNKLVVGGHRANKMATDCTTTELLCTGLTLVALFLIILFRHVLPGVIELPFRWRVVRCFFVEAALLSFHYRPISCLVAGNYFYAFSLTQGAAQALLFAIATALFAKHIHWRSIFTDEFDTPSELSLAGDVRSMSWNGRHHNDAAAAGSASRAALRSSTATRGTVATAAAASMQPECLECHLAPCRCHQMRERDRDVLEQARGLGLGGVVRANPDAISPASDDDEPDAEERDRNSAWPPATASSRPTASRGTSARARALEESQSREHSATAPGSRNASQATGLFRHGRGKVAPSDVGAVDELDF